MSYSGGSDGGRRHPETERRTRLAGGVSRSTEEGSHARDAPGPRTKFPA